MANAYSTFLGCKLACTQFIHQEPDEIGRQGCIVNMASIVGLVGIRYASKSPAYASRGSDQESLLIGNKVPIVLPKQQSSVSQKV